MQSKYKRILLKLSGEYLAGEQNYGFDFKIIHELCTQIVEIHNLGVEIALVVGGGNIFRGTQCQNFQLERVSGDHMGMLATIINSICLQETLEKLGKKTRVMTSIEVRDVAEPYVKRRAIRHLEKGRIVIFGGGTGNPYFSTDTAAVLRGKEIQAEVVIKGTLVDGVYDKDPNKHIDAKKYQQLDYSTVLEKNLKVMDATAISFCRDHNMPIYVVKISTYGCLLECILGKKIGTKIAQKITTI